MTPGAYILEQDRLGPELRRWAVAALVIVAAHAGLMAAYMMAPQPAAEGAAASPAVIVDLAPVPVAPSSPDDLAPGPEMVESQPTPKPPPEAKPEVVEPIEKVETPSEVTLPLPEPKAEEKKPEQKPEPEKAETTEPVKHDAPPAPRTTAAPRSEHRTAAKPQAPSPGSAASRKAIASWRDLVMMRLQQNKRYPSSAEARRQEGVVTLGFTVDRNGHVVARNIVHSSGVTALDDEVLAMIRRAEPLPAFPPAMQQPSVRLIVPIRFSLR